MQGDQTRRVLDYALNEPMALVLKSYFKAGLQAGLCSVSQSLLLLALILLYVFSYYIWHRYYMLVHHIKFNKKIVLLQKAFKSSVYLNTKLDISFMKATVLIQRAKCGRHSDTTLSICNIKCFNINQSPDHRNLSLLTLRATNKLYLYKYLSKTQGRRQNNCSIQITNFL